MGVVTEAILGGDIGNPLIVLDEIDKFVTHSAEKPYNSLLALLEPENACALVDEYLRVPFDLSRCMILATANDGDLLPSFIQDRFLIVTIAPPDGAMLHAIARRIAADIIAEHEWQKLRTIRTITGDGTTADYDMPSDFDRLPRTKSLWSSRLGSRYCHIEDLDQWLGMDVLNYDQAMNAWTIYGDQIHFKPTPSSGETISFWYQSNLIARPSGGGANKAAFDADGDTFRLSERLLKKGIIWRWRAGKGLPYAEHQEDYETVKERLIGADGGARGILKQPEAMNRDGVRIAYPVALSGL